MQFKRRDFFTFCLGLSIPASIAKAADNKKSEKNKYKTGKYSIMQGPTSGTATQLALVRTKNDRLSYYLHDDANDSFYMPENIQTFEWPGSEYVVDQVQFVSLPYAKELDLFVMNEKQEVCDHRRLQTLDLNKKNARIALVSCAADSFRLKSRQMWKALVEKQPELILFLGDNVYAGLLLPRPPSTVWRRHVETRQRLPIYRAKKLIPMLATWDDHDVGVDGANKDYVHMNDAQKIFYSFYPRENINTVFEAGPGVSSCFNGFGMRILMLDGRSLRASRKTDKHFLWGKEQYDWLLEKMAESVKPTWMINGTQFFGKSDEAVSSIDPNTFGLLLNNLRNYEAPVTFVSGDVHFSEVLELPDEILGYKAYELTSSSIHSYTFPLRALPKNPFRLAGEREYNFMIVDVETSAKYISMDVNCVLSESRSSFQMLLETKTG